MPETLFDRLLMAAQDENQPFLAIASRFVEVLAPQSGIVIESSWAAWKIAPKMYVVG